MKQILYLLVCLSALAWTVQACSDDNKSETPPAAEEPAITFPTGSDTQPVFTTEGGTSALTFTATEAWTASVGEADTRAIDWLTVSPTSGQAGTATLTITTEPNDTYDERNAAITLTSGGTRKTLTVTQKQRDALTVTSNKVELEATGGDFAIELQANVSVSYEIEESAKAWLTPASDTRALTTTTLHFQAAANEDLQPRQGIITLNGGNGLTEDITVYQLGSGPALILTQDEYLVGSDGETIKVELKSNNTYQIEMPSVDWITKADTRALSTYTHYFIVAPNETYDAREAVIRFVDEENGLEQTVSIQQMQRDAIVVAQDTYEVPTMGGGLELPVQTNVDFTVETDVDWINLREEDTKGLTEKVLTFVIASHMQQGDREGHIILSSETGVTQTIRVIQKGAIAYIKIVSPGDTIVSCNKGSIKLIMEYGYANSFECSSPDWIVDFQGNMEGHTDTGYRFVINFNIDANESAESRTGTIRIYDDEYGVSDEIEVTQEGNNQSDTSGGIDDIPVQPW